MKTYSIKKLTEGFLLTDDETGNQFAYEYGNAKDLVDHVTSKRHLVKCLEDLNDGKIVEVKIESPVT